MYKNAAAAVRPCQNTTRGSCFAEEAAVTDICTHPPNREREQYSRAEGLRRSHEISTLFLSRPLVLIVLRVSSVHRMWQVRDLIVSMYWACSLLLVRRGGGVPHRHRRGKGLVYFLVVAERRFYYPSPKTAPQRRWRHEQSAPPMLRMQPKSRIAGGQKRADDLGNEAAVRTK